jgi:hypothetical protein
MITPQHPAEEALLARCKEIGLDAQDTALLHDLLGWNNRNGGIPESYCGVEPQLTIIYSAGNAAETELVIGKNITQLLRKLIGEELMPSVASDPATTLQGKLGLPRLSAVWLVAQLRIEEEKCPDIYDEIQQLCRYAPEQMPDRVVRPTLSMLLTPH